MTDNEKLKAMRKLADDHMLKANEWRKDWEAASIEGNEAKASRCFGRYIALTQSARDIRDILGS